MAAAGLLDPGAAEQVEGKLLVDGRPAREMRARAGLVQQDPASSLVMSRVGDDVAFGPEWWGVAPDEIDGRVAEALDAVGLRLGLDHPTARLSGGEAQRLAIAGVLALRPGLLLLDEPTANLDPAGVLAVRDAVQRALDRTGATLVLVEHRSGPWRSLVDRVVELDADPLPEEPARWSWAPPGAGAALLGAEQVRHRHRGAQRDSPSEVSLELHEGRALAVSGANGAGKTTLALALGGLLRPSGGRVRVRFGPDQDRDLHRWRAGRLAGVVGSVFQRPEQQFLTPRVDLEVELGAQRAGRAAPVRRAGDLLEQLGLAGLAGADPHTLSGGEQRRLSVACVLAAEPRVLVLDEPTFGQDAGTWAALVALLQQLLDGGCALAAVTHDPALADALAAEVREVR